MILNSLESNNLATTLKVDLNQLDYQKIQENLKEVCPEIDTLLNVTTLEMPKDPTSLGQFVDDLKHGFDQDAGGKFIGKVSVLQSFDAVAFYDQNPQIGVFIKELIKNPKEKRYFFDQGAISDDEVKAENDPFKISSYFMFVEKVADKLRLTDVKDVFKNTLIVSQSEQSNKSLHR